MADLLIKGECDKRFQRVRAAFEENFQSRNEVGASVAVTIDGHPVVDLWGGHLDNQRGKSWGSDTIANVYSTTKGLTAICAHRLVDQGMLNLDAPVAGYWPEFAQAGKQSLPVRMLLNHRAGLPAIKEILPPEALFDWDAMCAALAEQEPWWTPGSSHGYHALTFGWLVGEVVRRISGKSLGSFFRDEIAAPLGLDCHIGLPETDDSRVAPLLPSPPPPPEQVNIFAEIMKNPESVTARAFANPPTITNPGVVNSRQWRAAEIPAANGHTNARALARLYGALARGGELDGHRVLSAQSLARCHGEQSHGRDEVLLINTRFSSGFMLSQPGAAFGPNARTFGHPGAGGSVGYADLDARVGFGYVMNQMGPSILLDPRAIALIDAVYASL